MALKNTHQLFNKLNTWDKNSMSQDTHKYGATNGNKYYSAALGKYVIKKGDLDNTGCLY